MPEDVFSENPERDDEPTGGGEDIFSAERENRENRKVIEREVEVVGVHERAMHFSQQAFVVLKDRRGRKLHIWIGHPEAVAIALALEEEARSQMMLRPMTHDLMKGLLEKVGARVERVVIDDLWQNTFYAKLHLATNGKIQEVDCRPSDAIAIGLRFGAPIFVAEDVLEDGQVEEE